jgi:SAM-dependent methyltransferase
MGGVLPEQPDPTIFHRILDIGCGTGDWLIETAKTYPDMSLLIGVDISNKMVEYARAQAVAEQVNDRNEDEKAFFRAIIPFLRKWTRVPDDYEEIYQQMLSEMQQPDFVATWNLLTVWGTMPD